MALREHLIATAERLLGERQIGDITTRDIAREAEVSDGVLYNYFASKNDLLVTALIRRFARGVSQFLEDLPEPGHGTIEESLTILTRAMFELHAEAIPTVAGLITEPPLLHQFLTEIHQPPFGAQMYPGHVAAYLRDEQRLGRLSGVNVEAATTLLMGSTFMLALSGVIRHESHGDTSSQLPDIVQTLLEGLKPAPSATDT